jgi:Fic family protein
MRYIHQDPGWPKFFWDDAKLLPVLSAVRLRQGRLLGQMGQLGFRFKAEAGLENLTAEVIKSSAIEGTIFDPEAVRSSVARRMGLPTANEASAGRDIDGAVEMLLDATQNYDKPLTEDRLLGWQSALFPTGRSGLRRILVGAWRTPEMDPMQVVSGPISREQTRRKNIHFEAPAAKRLPHEVGGFLTWFESAEGADPVLRAGLAHLWLVTIHPFEDGNGRVSRAVADMALARSEDTGFRFYSMSTQIEAQKKQYYEILERTQKGTMDVTDWLVVVPYMSGQCDHRCPSVARPDSREVLHLGMGQWSFAGQRPPKTGAQHLFGRRQFRAVHFEVCQAGQVLTRYRAARHQAIGRRRCLRVGPERRPQHGLPFAFGSPCSALSGAPART